MIQLQGLAVRYGDRTLFQDVNIQINPLDKIALIGRNGVGKSTLFEIIDDLRSPDEGKVQRQKGVQTGHLQQILHINLDQTVRQAAEEAFKSLLDLETRNEEIQHQLEIETDYQSDGYLKLIEELNTNLERLQHFDSANKDKKIELVLKGLGFKSDEFDRKLSTLSGGWQMRVQLAQLLLEEPDLLLLDEPTNHLDIEAIIWLEGYIINYPGSVISISHDRAFLRNTSARILEIENAQLYDYPVNYDKYLLQKAEVRAKQEAAYNNQQREIARKERTIKRFMAKASKTSMAQSMQKQLNKMERIELDAIDQANMRIRFLPVARSARTVIKAQQLAKNYGSKEVLRDLSFEVERGDRIAIVGQNGQGKTTLIKSILGEVDLTSGACDIGSQVDVGYYAQNQSELLDEEETILEFMELRAPEGMRTRVRNILGAFLFSGDDVEKKIKVLSGGERARVAFAHLLMQPINLLILDEPTNHLDMDSKEVLRNALLDYQGTLLVVSHDRDFLSDLTTKTFELRDHKIFEYLGDVNYFLEKRALDNMREVALQHKIPQANQKTKASAVSNQERRELQRSVDRAERKVLKCEEKIQRLETLMADPGFYDQEDAQVVMNKYAQAKEDLAMAESAWEEAVDVMQQKGIST